MPESDTAYVVTVALPKALRALRALKACLPLVDEVEQRIDAEYKDTLTYPCQRRRYERDIAEVRAARAALAEFGGSQ